MADALLRLREARERIEVLEAEKHGELAVVGMGLRFPGRPGSGDAADPESFWRLLEEGADLVRPTPPERWDVERFHDPDYDAPGRIVAREGAYLADPALFDPQFFGIAPREAETMDPQQRLLLETCWRALEHAGLSPDAMRGSRTGVFVGIATADYSIELVRRLSYDEIVAQTGTGTNHSVAAGRIAFTLGLTGPCLAVNTACSSSLVALQLACESLRRRECDAALVAGVNLMLSPMTSMVFSNARMLSRDGRCKTFDARADGYGRAEGTGVLVLKRLRDAARDRDRILACVLGVATNQDGASGGMTVPHGPAQQAVIRAALANARVEPAAVSYVEAHGTGTALGDPIELGALGAVFADPDGRRARPLAVASLKTNLGHAEAAAGVAGVIKTILQLEHRRIAPHLHLATPSTHVPWDRLPLRVPTAAEDWPSAGRRIAGVSSFGFSGTNAHVVLGEAPPPTVEGPAEPDPGGLVLPLSARSPAALRELAEEWSAFLARSATPAADACFTAGRGRAHFPHRLAVVGADAAELSRGLATWASDGRGPGVFQGEVHERLTAKSLTLPATASEVALAYVEGLRIPWDALDVDRRRGRVTVPGYPFQRERYWGLPAGAPPAASAGESFVFTRWTWSPKPAPPGSAPNGRWTVLGEGGLVRTLHGGLESRGVDCAIARDASACDVVVFAWEALDRPAEGERGAVLLLELIQALAALARPPRLCVVTRDGVSDAALQGLARVAAIEHPELSLRRIVADGGSDAEVAAELLGDDGEDEVRLSHDLRAVGRLEETAPMPARTLALGGVWLVTGGLGALGRRLTTRLLERGATRVVVVGRSAGALPVELAGLPVEVRACDVADPAACAELTETLPALEGVVHAAGVLDDGVISELSPERLIAVLRPKLAGAWNLHESLATRESLRHFVLISSSAALLGSPGQGNYVAANWTLEALARARRRAGLVALTVHFGPLTADGEGMGADDATARRLTSLGLRTSTMTRALDALETMLAHANDEPAAGRPPILAEAALGYFTLDWRSFARAVPPGVEPRRLDPFLAALPTQAAEGEPELLSELLDAEAEERPGMLADYVARALGRVLRMPADAIDRRRTLPELGLDSLLGIELRNRIQGDLSITTPMGSILGASSTAALAADLLALLHETGLVVDLEGGHELSPEMLAEIEGLSDEEVERLLGEESGS